MQLTAETLSDGRQYTPGICIICHQSFDEESSGGYYFVHKACVEKFEHDLREKKKRKQKT